MAVLLITYDLNREAKRPNIVKDIKAYGSWAKLSESSYAIKTDKSASTVYAELEEHIDGNDQLYVINLRKPWMGFGPKDVNDWLDDNLPG